MLYNGMKFSSLAANGDRLSSQVQYTSENRKSKHALPQFCLPLNRHIHALGLHALYPLTYTFARAWLSSCTQNNSTSASGLSLQLSVSTLNFNSCSCYLLCCSCVTFQITSSLEFIFCTYFLYFKHIIQSHILPCITCSSFLLPKLEPNRISVRRDDKWMS